MKEGGRGENRRGGKGKGTLEEGNEGNNAYFFQTNLSPLRIVGKRRKRERKEGGERKLEN